MIKHKLKSGLQQQLKEKTSWVGSNNAAARDACKPPKREDFAAPAWCQVQDDALDLICSPPIDHGCMCVFVQVERGGNPGLPHELLHRAHLLLQHHPRQPVPRRPPLQGHVPAHRRHRGPAAAVRPQQAAAQWSVPLAGGAGGVSGG